MCDTEDANVNNIDYALLLLTFGLYILEDIWLILSSNKKKETLLVSLVNSGAILRIVFICARL